VHVYENTKKKNKTSRKPSDFAIVCQVVYSVTSK
jgi:hypothetical protein